MSSISRGQAKVSAIKAIHHLLLPLAIVSALAIRPATALAEMPVGPAGWSPSPDSGSAVHHDTSPPLRSLRPSYTRGHAFPARPTPPVPSASSRTPAHDMSGTQPASESSAQLTSPLMPSASTSFDGIAANGWVPPDSSGAAGLSQYVEVVNIKLAVYSKSGAMLIGPEATNTLWKGFGGGCEHNNDGDGTVLFDTLNQRWVVQQFSVSTTPYLDCVAVSSSSDATGTWHRYSFQYGYFPDYPKMGVWPDAYYASFNLFNGNEEFVGAEVCAFNRAAMLSGAAASQQCIAGYPNGGSSLLPATLDGPMPPPTGEPEWFVALSPTAANALAYWKFHVDWSNPANTTFTGPTNLAVGAFSEACGGGTCIPQAETSQKLESLGDRLMYRLAYRNFGGHEAMVVSHAVTAGSSVGMRWYELRPSGGSVSVYQQGTYAPEGAYRWMGSIAMDKESDMALGYSVSSGSLHPQIRYTGRLAGDTLGTMPQGEATLYQGAGSQTEYPLEPRDGARWGDYTQMSVDPSDDCTFWYVNEYEPSNGVFNWHTRIGSFKFPGCSGWRSSPTQMVLSGGGEVLAKTGIGYAGWTQETPAGERAIAAGDGGLQMVLDGAGQVWAKSSIGEGGWTQETPAGETAIAAGGGGLQMIIDGGGQVWAKYSIGNGGWTQETPAGQTAIAAGGGGLQMVLESAGKVWAENSIGSGWTLETPGGGQTAIAAGGGGLQMVLESAGQVWAENSIGNGWTQETTGGQTAIAAGGY